MNKYIRTDLAMEIGEKYKEDNVEIEGVEIKEMHNDKGTIKTTVVNIFNDKGAMAMGREKGKYITIENLGVYDSYKYDEEELIMAISKELRGLIKSLFEGRECQNKNITKIKTKDITKNKDKQSDKYIHRKLNVENILVVGLGNIEITPDALGPNVVNMIDVSRYILTEKGIAALAPGVMGQTGLEVSEIVKALVKEINIELVIVIDALAARSVYRLNNTIQLTNTGIAPGSGVGNNRKEISNKSVGVPVIAVGIPTVVDAYSIVNDIVERFLVREGCKESEINEFLEKMRKENIENMFVTSKVVDVHVKKSSEIVAKGINLALNK
ncbi:MAG: GPR endopeptidase [Lachnospiraceae bacterium]|nr:GPR endopeptidase [Lachnospiraceae bacterium]